MFLRHSGGQVVKTEPLFMIFTKKDRNYPICGVPDNDPGVSYRTRQKVWMDSTNMLLWLNEKRALRDGKMQTLFIDN